MTHDLPPPPPQFLTGLDAMVGGDPGGHFGDLVKLDPTGETTPPYLSSTPRPVLDPRPSSTDTQSPVPTPLSSSAPGRCFARLPDSPSYVYGRAGRSGAFEYPSPSPSPVKDKGDRSGGKLSPSPVMFLPCRSPGK